MDTKEELKELSKEIDEKIYQKKLISNVENELNSLNTNIKECISLISSSIKGKKVNEIINNLTEENKKLTEQCNSTIIEDKQKINNHLNELNDYHTLLQEKLRKQEEEKKENNE